MNPLGLGEHGDVIYGKRGRSVIAMVNFRDFSGRRRRIKRAGPTRAAARREVLRALELAATVGDEPHITASAKLGDAAKEWLLVVEERVAGGPAARQPWISTVMQSRSTWPRGLAT